MKLRERIRRELASAEERLATAERRACEASSIAEAETWERVVRERRVALAAVQRIEAAVYRLVEVM